MRHEAEMRAILKQVELWPAEERRELADALATKRDADSEAAARELPPMPSAPPVFKATSLLDLVGIGNPTGRHIGDEEVEQLKYEHLRDKYLR